MKISTFEKLRRNLIQDKYNNHSVLKSLEFCRAIKNDGHFEDFCRPIFYTPTWTEDYYHLSTENKHQNFLPRLCRVNLYFDTC